MNDKWERWINARAYALWEELGHTDGCDRKHGLQAAQEYELVMQTRASIDGVEILGLQRRD